MQEIGRQTRSDRGVVWQRYTVCLLYICLLAGLAIDRVAAGVLEQRLPALLTELEAPVAQSPHDRPAFTVALGNFTYDASGVGSAFGLYVTQLLAREISQRGTWQLVSQQVLRTLLQQQHSNLAAFLQSGHSAASGPLLGLDLLLTGRYRLLGETVAMTIWLLRPGTGATIATVGLQVPLHDLRPGLEVQPVAYSRGLQRRDELTHLGVQGSQFELKVWTDKGDGSVYQRGEHIVVFVSAAQPCYLKLLYNQADDRVLQIFPNQFHTDNRLQAHEVLSIPGSHYQNAQTGRSKFAFEVAPPFGVELLKAICSARQFPDLQSPDTRSMKLVSRSTAEYMRKFATTDAQDLTAEAVTTLTTVDRIPSLQEADEVTPPPRP